MENNDSRQQPPRRPVTADPIIVVFNDDPALERNECLQGTDVYGDVWVEVMGAFKPTIGEQVCELCGARIWAGWRRKKDARHFYCSDHVFYIGVTFRSIRGEVLIGNEKARRRKR